MTKRAKDTAGLIVRKGPKGLFPASPFDYEQLSSFPIGTEFMVRSLTKRSLPQHRTYWRALSLVVQATDAYPTAEHLHDAIKRDLGFVETVMGLDGKPFTRSDSTAFDAMGQEEFQGYFDRAMARLADVLGIDPLAWLAEPRARTAA